MSYNLVLVLTKNKSKNHGETKMEQPLDKRLINIMRKAIQSERIAYKRYVLAESIVESSEEKKLFQTLAEEETKHEELLMIRMREIKKAMGLEVAKKEEKKVEAPKKAKKTKKKEEKKEEAKPEVKEEKKEE
jgi:rubrerythrin